MDVISRIDAILGEIALERVRKGGFELVVTDLAMPSFNGLRLIQALREMHRDTPVIAVSGQNAEQLTLAEDFGAVATLIKPLDRRLLVSEVERVAGQASSLWNYALYVADALDHSAANPAASTPSPAPSPAERISGSCRSRSSAAPRRRLSSVP